MHDCPNCEEYKAGWQRALKREHAARLLLKEMVAKATEIERQFVAEGSFLESR